MVVYSLRRLGWAVIELLMVGAITFFLIYLVPADPARAIAGPHANAATIQIIRHQLGLDQPVYWQFLRYIGRVVRGNFGTSIQYDVPVIRLLWQHFPATLLLTIGGVILEVLIGLPLGLISAFKRHSIWDHLSSGFVFLGLAMPPFWVGTVLLFLLGYRLKLLPIGGYGAPWAAHLLLPALTLGIGGAAYYARLLRARVLDVMDQPFVRVAQAKGLSYRQVVIRHIGPNVLPSLLTQMGMDWGYFMGGVVVVEVVFGWPGIGWQAWMAIQNLDIPLIVGTVLFGAGWIILANLVTDLLYLWIDPRVRMGS